MESAPMRNDLSSEEENIVEASLDLIRAIKSYDPTKSSAIDDLLKKEVNINFQDANRQGNTPLHFAARFGHLGLIQCLLNNGADSSIRNCNQETPLDVAIKHNQPDVVAELRRNASKKQHRVKALKPRDVEPFCIDFQSDDPNALNRDELEKNPHFRIVRIANGSGITKVLHFMKELHDLVLDNAPYWFLTVVKMQQFTLVQPEKQINVNFNEQRPFIIQWESIEDCKCFVTFKQSNSSKITTLDLGSSDMYLSEKDLATDLNKGPFDLLLLVKALNSRLCGELNGDLLKSTIDTSKQFNNKTLIDYAAQGDDCLSLRLLTLLADWNLDKAIVIAAEKAGPQSLAAILDLPLINSSTDQLYCKKRNLLEVKNEDGNTPLLLAASKGRQESLNLLIRCGSDIFYENKKQKAIDLALLSDKNSWDKVLMLLQAGTRPLEVKATLEELKRDLESLVKEKRHLQMLAVEEKKRIVEQFIKKHPALKRAYDVDFDTRSSGLNQSIDICNYLVSRTRFRFQQDHEDQTKLNSIISLYRELNEIPLLKPMIEILGHSKLDIYYDFSSSSVEGLHPTAGARTQGLCVHRDHSIYIGAGIKEDELRGVVAHEFCHMAMQICYNNDCNPFYRYDDERMEKFTQVIEKVNKNKDSLDPIVQNAFLADYDYTRPAELIVRVPQLLAKYCHDKCNVGLEGEVSELYTFYCDQVFKDLQSYLANPKKNRLNEPVQELNGIFQQFDEIFHFPLKLKEAREPKLLWTGGSHTTIPMNILASSNPWLSLINFYSRLKRDIGAVATFQRYVFIGSNFSVLNGSEIMSKLVDVLSADDKVHLVFNCCAQFCELMNTLENFNNFIGSLPEMEKFWKRITVIASYQVVREKYPKAEQETCKLDDFDEESQRSILAKCVKSIDELLQLSISERLSSDAQVDNEELYVERSFSHPVLIKKEIKAFIDGAAGGQEENEESKDSVTDMLVFSEAEFKAAEKGQQKSVHWLENYSESKFRWRQSHGNLQTIRNYRDKHQTIQYDTEKDFIEQVKSEKLIVISDIAGMGKSTVLARISSLLEGEEEKDGKLTDCIVTIKLHKHKGALKDYQDQEPGAFLAEHVLKFPNTLEREIFEKLFDSGRVILMLDGFDEVTSVHTNVINLLKKLRDSKMKQLWITTRPLHQEELEDELQSISYHLQHFSENCQSNYLVKYWKHNCAMQNTMDNHLKDRAKNLIESVAKFDREEGTNLLSTPLILELVAEIYKDKQIGDLSLSTLYTSIINQKYQVALQKIDLAGHDVIDIRFDADASSHENHECLALNLILKDKSHPFNLQPTKRLTNKQFQSIGLTMSINEETDFIHRTFAEYFLARFVIRKLEANGEEAKVIDFLLEDVMAKQEYQMTLAFMNDFFAKQVDKVASFGGKLAAHSKTLLFKAVKEGNDRIVQLIRKALEQLPEESRSYLSYHCDSKEPKVRGKCRIETVWSLAAKQRNVKVFQKLWDWTAELEPGNHSKVLLNKDQDENLLVHLAVESGSVGVLEKMLEFAPLCLSSDELKGLIRAKNYDGKTVWHMAVEEEHERVIGVLCQWIKERQLLLDNEMEGLIRFLCQYAKRKNRASSLRETLMQVGEMWTLSEVVQTELHGGPKPRQYLLSEK